MKFFDYTLFVVSFLSIGCTLDGKEQLKLVDANQSPLDVQEEALPEGALIEDHGDYILPADCFVNPFLNCQGASLGNFLNAYYLVSDFKTFYAFINNSSKKKYGYDALEAWFNKINFGYEIHAVNIVDRLENFGVLVYRTNINNTTGRLKLPFIIENDTAKLFITNIERGIEAQYYENLPLRVDDFINVVRSLEDLEEVTVLKYSNSVVLNFGGVLMFDSGDHQLNPKGIEVLEKIIKVLAVLETNNLKVECIGYADNDVYRVNKNKDIRNNLDLSVMRASTVAQYLIHSGVVKDNNCLTSGVGDAKERHMKLNKESKRKVEIVLTY